VVRRFAVLRFEVEITHQRVGCCDREDRVIRKVRVLLKQGKVLAAVIVELIDRANDVANDRA